MRKVRADGGSESPPGRTRWWPGPRESRAKGDAEARAWYPTRGMITLAIDTSTARGSVALLAYGDVAFEEHFSADRSHTAKLFTALQTARTRARHVDRIAVGLGPGSYAGLRVAI